MTEGGKATAKEAGQESGHCLGLDNPVTEASSALMPAASNGSGTNHPTPFGHKRPLAVGRGSKGGTVDAYLLLQGMLVEGEK